MDHITPHNLVSFFKAKSAEWKDGPKKDKVMKCFKTWQSGKDEESFKLFVAEIKKHSNLCLKLEEYVKELDEPPAKRIRRHPEDQAIVDARNADMIFVRENVQKLCDMVTAMQEQQLALILNVRAMQQDMKSLLPQVEVKESTTEDAEVTKVNNAQEQEDDEFS
tara:strand:+ start:1070 stop:1561 length:492 start_codon:yes stop_codon:yes gene_type:complete